MLNRIKNIFKLKIPLYINLMVVFVVLVSAIIFIKYNKEQQIQKNSKQFFQRHKEEIYVNGALLEGYYDKGKKVGKWYYYNQKGYLSFVNDIDQNGKKYTISPQGGYSGAPWDVIYNLPKSEKGIVAKETYQMGSLTFLDIYIPSKNIRVVVAYDDDRYITEVEYHKIESNLQFGESTKRKVKEKIK